MFPLGLRIWANDKMVYSNKYHLDIDRKTKTGSISFIKNDISYTSYVYMIMTNGNAINGEIYEYDIIHHIDKEDIYYIVYFDMQQGCFYAANGNLKIKINDVMKRFEVAGNVLEDPELINNIPYEQNKELSKQLSSLVDLSRRIDSRDVKLANIADIDIGDVPESEKPIPNKMGPFDWENVTKEEHPNCHINNELDDAEIEDSDEEPEKDDIEEAPIIEEIPETTIKETNETPVEETPSEDKDGYGDMSSLLKAYTSNTDNTNDGIDMSDIPSIDEPQDIIDETIEEPEIEEPDMPDIEEPPEPEMMDIEEPEMPAAPEEPSYGEISTPVPQPVAEEPKPIENNKVNNVQEKKPNVQHKKDKDTVKNPIDTRVKELATPPKKPNNPNIQNKNKKPKNPVLAVLTWIFSPRNEKPSHEQFFSDSSQTKYYNPEDTRLIKGQEIEQDINESRNEAKFNLNLNAEIIDKIASKEDNYDIDFSQQIPFVHDNSIVVYFEVYEDEENHISRYSFEIISELTNDCSTAEITECDHRKASLLGLIDIFEQCEGVQDLKIITSMQYITMPFNKGLLVRWASNDWKKTNTNVKIKYSDEWKQAYNLSQQYPYLDVIFIPERMNCNALVNCYNNAKTYTTDFLD